MRRHCKLIISTITMALIFSILPLHTVAYADPFTASQIASASYALFNSWGISFTAGNATASGMNDFMSQRVEDYVNSSGGSISDLFIGNIAVDAVGKLVVAYDMYNSIVDFGKWLIDKYDLSSVDFSLTDGEYQGKFLPYEEKGTSSITGVGIEATFIGSSGPPDHYAYGYFYNGGSLVWGQSTGSQEWGYDGTYSIAYNGQIVVGYMPMTNRKGNVYIKSANIATVAGLNNSLVWNGSEYVTPDTINPGKEWIGDIDGYSIPDTNLDQLLGGINSSVADNSLSVDGEVIDVPIPPEPVPSFPPLPPPIPEPIDPDIPISSETSGGVNSWIQGLGDIAESTFEGLNSIYQVVTGAINQALNDIKEAIGALANWLEDILEALRELGLSISEILTDILEAIADIADSIVNADANWFSDIVDAILTPFRPWINTLKSATGLWHYIIEWLQCIATPFGFFWSVLAGIGSCFVRPIYAVAAFAIVIAIYKRFGK